MMEFNLTHEVEKAKSGDSQAFERILKEFDRPILNFLYRRLNSRPDAEDLTQETFLRFYLYLAKVKPDQNVKSLIFTIANHLLYDHFRKNRRERELLLLDSDEPPYGATSGLNETINDDLTYYFTEASDQISRAISQLPLKYQQVIDLSYIQGFTNQEISEIIGVPLNTVKTHLSRARQQLKVILDRHDNI